MRRNLVVILCSFAAGFAFVGCSGAPGSSSETTGAQSSPDKIERLVFRAQPDGTWKSESTLITREEQLLEFAQRAQLEQARASGGFHFQDIQLDPGCADSSMWLFTLPNRTGAEACFFQDGSMSGTSPTSVSWVGIDLSQWFWNCPAGQQPWCQQHLNVTLQSAWGGTDPACISEYSRPSAGNDFINMTPFQPVDSMSAPTTNFLYIVPASLPINPGGVCSIAPR